MTVVYDVMMDAIMTLVFAYSTYKFRDTYPLLSIVLTICYLTSLMMLIYNRYNPNNIIF